MAMSHDPYPWRRYLLGTADFLLGGYTGVAGFLLMMERGRPDDETLVGLSATVLGAVIGFDGLIRVFHRSPVEWEYPHYRRMKPDGGGLWSSKEEYGTRLLRRNAETGRDARLIRGGAGLLAAAHYFYLATKSDARYRKLIYPGATLTLLSLYRLLWNSPEEDGWELYQERTTRKKAARPFARWHWAAWSDGESLFLSTSTRF